MPWLCSLPADRAPLPECGSVILRVREGVLPWERWSGLSVRRLEVESLRVLRPEALGRPVRVLLRRVGAGGVPARALLEEFRRRDCPIWVEPVPGEELSVFREAARQEVPVVVTEERLDALLGPQVLEMLDFYLFQEELATPVEPFHSLLMSAVARSGRSLLQVWFGVPTDYFYVHESGAVSLCRRWAEDPGRTYGTADGDPRSWQSSSAHEFLRGWLQGHGLPQPCGSCPVRRLCGGALLLIEPGADCAWWREVLERIRIVAARIGGSRPSSRARGRNGEPRPA